MFIKVTHKDTHTQTQTAFSHIMNGRHTHNFEQNQSKTNGELKKAAIHTQYI